MSDEPRNPYQYASPGRPAGRARGVPERRRRAPCRSKAFIGARTELDEQRLAALAPDPDPATVRPHLAAIERIAHGDPAGGPMASLSIPERFHWLVSPASTIIQPSAVHTGLTDDPAAELEHLFETLVR